MKRALLAGAVAGGALLFASTAAGYFLAPTWSLNLSPGLPSPVVGRVSFATSGAASWPGAPSPTVDCVADAAGGTMTCVGATASKQGSPTTGTSPYYLSGFTGTQASAAVLNGSSDYYALGNTANPTGAFTVCGVFSPSSVSGYHMIASKAQDTPGRVWELLQGSAALYFKVYQDASNSTRIDATSSLVAGAWTIACGSYSWDGANSLLKFNVNGTAISDVSNTKGPPASSTAALRIGLDEASYFAGSIRQVTQFNGWAASTAELAQMVRSYQTLLASKPQNAAITWTRNATETVCPLTDATCYTVAANTPAVSQYGAGVWPARSNLELYSAALISGTSIGTGWGDNTTGVGLVTCDGVSSTCDDDAATDPLGGTTADAVTYSTTGAGLYQRTTGLSSNTAYTASIWVWTNTGTKTFYLARTNGVTWATATKSAALTATTTPQRFSLTYTTGAAETQSDFNVLSHNSAKCSAGTYYLWGAQHEAGTVATPYIATGASPVSPPATAASVAPQIPSLSSWAISATAYAADWTAASTSQRTIWGLGAGNGNNTARLIRWTDGYLYFVVYDSGANPQFIRGLASSLAAGAHTFVSTYAGGTLGLLVDGAPWGAAGGSASVLSGNVPATLYIGSDSTAGREFGGYISVPAIQCKSARAGACK